MTPERLAEIKARAEAATPEEHWLCFPEEIVAHEDDEFPRWVVPTGVRQRLDDLGDGDETKFAQAKADSVFIAHARQDIPDLLAEVERLQAALEGMNR